MRFAVITIELPLDGGEMEDAKTLADLIAEKALTSPEQLEAMDRDNLFQPHHFRPAGQVVDVRLEDRPSGVIGHARARSIMDSQR